MNKKQDDIDKFNSIKKEYGKNGELPIPILIAEFKDISEYSLRLVENRISIDKYKAKNTLKRNFYKLILLSYK